MTTQTQCKVCGLPEAEHTGTEAHRYQASHIPVARDRIHTLPNGLYLKASGVARGEYTLLYPTAHLNAVDEVRDQDIRELKGELVDALDARDEALNKLAQVERFRKDAQEQVVLVDQELHTIRAELNAAIQDLQQARKTAEAYREGQLRQMALTAQTHEEIIHLKAQLQSARRLATMAKRGITPGKRRRK
jgi:hypothetical protein